MIKIDWKRFLTDYIVLGFHIHPFTLKKYPERADKIDYDNYHLVFKWKWILTFKKFTTWVEER